MSETTFLPCPIASIALILFAFLTPALAQTASIDAIALIQRDKPVDKTIKTRSESLGIDDYQKLLAKDPGDVISQNNLGVLYFRVGRYDEGIDLIRKAADLKPDMW